MKLPKTKRKFSGKPMSMYFDGMSTSEGTSGFCIFDSSNVDIASVG